jgi:transposase-like protein
VIGAEARRAEVEITSGALRRMGRSTEGESTLSEARKYRTLSAQQKIEMVLAGIRGDRTIKEVCWDHQIAETLYHGWRELMRASGTAGCATLCRLGPGRNEAAGWPWVGVAGHGEPQCRGSGASRADPDPRRRARRSEPGGFVHTRGACGLNQIDRQVGGEDTSGIASRGPKNITSEPTKRCLAV